jgi:hypothetical protein
LTGKSAGVSSSPPKSLRPPKAVDIPPPFFLKNKPIHTLRDLIF